MKRRIITTGDGSKTIQIEEWNEQYHSIHGAINEANHVFIKHGLLFFMDNVLDGEGNSISVLEIGFGTGLNAILTLQSSQRFNFPIHYVGVEAYPVDKSEWRQLNYVESLPKDLHSYFNALHELPWNEEHRVSDLFLLEKQQKFFQDIRETETYDLIYFDAFGARVQPELWTESIFKLMFDALKVNGVLVTYSAKGSVRRAMQAVGFEVERLPGPPGKREMLRGLKRS